MFFIVPQCCGCNRSGHDPPPGVESVSLSLLSQAANPLTPLSTATSLSGMDLLSNAGPTAPVSVATAPQEQEVTHQAALSL